MNRKMSNEKLAVSLLAVGLLSATLMAQTRRRPATTARFKTAWRRNWRRKTSSAM